MTKLKYLTTVLLATMLLGALASATTYRELTLDDMVAQTEIAFYGEVTSLTSSERDGDPWTDVSFQIEEAYLGIAEDVESLDLSFYGGTLDDGRSLSINLMPSFQVGDRVVVFAYQGELYSPVVGFRQGLWRERNLGLVDETDRALSLDEEGELILDGPGAGLDDLLAALRARIEAAQ